MDDSYYGLFVPFSNIIYATKVNVYVCLSVSLFNCVGGLHVLKWYTNISVTAYHCSLSLFHGNKRVHSVVSLLPVRCSTETCGYWNPQLPVIDWAYFFWVVCSAVDMGTVLTTAKHCWQRCLDYSFLGLAIRTLDYSYYGWTIRTVIKRALVHVGSEGHSSWQRPRCIWDFIKGLTLHSTDSLEVREHLEELLRSNS